jgi:hypothetical protein
VYSGQGGRFAAGCKRWCGRPAQQAAASRCLEVQNAVSRLLYEYEWPFSLPSQLQHVCSRVGLELRCSGVAVAEGAAMQRSTAEIFQSSNAEVLAVLACTP